MYFALIQILRINFKCLKIGCIYFCLISIPLATFSQTDTLVFNPIHNQALQQTEIRNLSVAKDGKLWLSTNKGIASFDGTEVNFFGHKESDNITSMWSSSISFLNPIEDKKSNLFVVTISGPTYYFDTKTGKANYLEIMSNNKKNYIPQPYSDIYIENDSSIWLARYNGSFLHYKVFSKKTTYYNITDDENSLKNVVTCIRKDQINSDLLWLATKNGIYSFNIRSGTLHRNFRCNNVKDSSDDDVNIVNIDVVKDTIWFTAGAKGVGCYDTQSGLYTIFSYHSSVSDNTLFDIKYFQRKNIEEYYFGTEKMAPGTFNIKTHQYSFKAKITGNFPGLKIDKFIADSNGNCWCLIFGQLFYASNLNNKFKVVPLMANRSKNVVRVFKTVIYNEKEHNYYAAFDKSDNILVFNEKTIFLKSISIIHNKNDFVNNTVTDIGFDKNGRLWATGQNLFLYDSINRQMQPVKNEYPNLPFSNQGFQNMVFREKYLYTLPSSSSCKSIYRINTNTFTYDSVPLPDMMLDKKGVNQFGVLEIDSKSNYAYISNKRTLYQYNLKNGQIKLIIGLRFESIPFSFYSNFHWYEIDDHDNLWVSTNGIIRVYEPKELRVLKKIQKDHEVYLLQSTNFSHRGIMGFINSGGVELFDYINDRHYKLTLSDGLTVKMNSGISSANNLLFVGSELDAIEYIPINVIVNQHLKRTCYLSNIQLFNQPYTTDTLPEYLHSIKLAHDKNFITLTFSSTEFEQPERLEYRYKLQGVDEDWVYTTYLNRTISYPDLKPGNYIFFTAIKNLDGSWNGSKVNLNINIIPAWWQTTWFKTLLVATILLLISLIARRRIKVVRRQEQVKSLHEKALLELEAKALRAQMNPHFIFNCMNSIKSLIQQKEEDKAINYLTTFSKLIRTIFNNSDKREISLYDEIETCRLYTQLERMRFGNKFNYAFNVDEAIDLKSIMVPALIVQPFIENAIWHGIVPRETGGNVDLYVTRKNGNIEIIVEDDGIGREVSQKNKSVSNLTHQSKGVNLTQSRLKLDNQLKQRQANLEIIDKRGDTGKATGTKVIIKINDEES